MDPESRGSVDHVTCLRELVGEMKEGRKHLIHQVPTHVQCHMLIIISSYCTYVQTGIIHQCAGMYTWYGFICCHDLLLYLAVS